MRILVIGGDRRMDYAAEKLSGSYETRRFGSEQDDDVKGLFDAVVLPLPLSKNGSHVFAPSLKDSIEWEVIEDFSRENALIFAGGSSPGLTELCSEKGYRLENYFARETLTLKNAALTAEAACAMLAQSTDGALLNSSALVTGYGRIARFLAKRLSVNGCNVTIAARRAEQREIAVLDGLSAVPVEEMSGTLGDYDFIANTVPFTLFSEKEFLLIRKDCVFMELATLPEQPTRSAAESAGIRYVFASGLPGKCSPKAAGICIAEEILKTLKVISKNANFERKLS